MRALVLEEQFDDVETVGRHRALNRIEMHHLGTQLFELCQIAVFRGSLEDSTAILSCPFLQQLFHHFVLLTHQTVFEQSSVHHAVAVIDICAVLQEESQHLTLAVERHALDGRVDLRGQSFLDELASERQFFR